MKITENIVKQFVEYTKEFSSTCKKKASELEEEIKNLNQKYTKEEYKNINKIFNYRNFDKNSIFGVIIFFIPSILILINIPFVHWNNLDLPMVSIFLGIGTFFLFYYIVGMVRLYKINKYIKKLK